VRTQVRVVVGFLPAGDHKEPRSSYTGVEELQRGIDEPDVLWCGEVIGSRECDQSRVLEGVEQRIRGPSEIAVAEDD
jgi:hypothetical protein